MQLLYFCVEQWTTSWQKFGHMVELTFEFAVNMILKVMLHGTIRNNDF